MSFDSINDKIIADIRLMGKVIRENAIVLVKKPPAWGESYNIVERNNNGKTKGIAINPYNIRNIISNALGM